MSEDKPKEKESEKKDEKFYEPRNWDKHMRIEDDPTHAVGTYCGKCGHIIYEHDNFCTKCGTESKREKI